MLNCNCLSVNLPPEKFGSEIFHLNFSGPFPLAMLSISKGSIPMLASNTKPPLFHLKSQTQHCSYSLCLSDLLGLWENANGSDCICRYSLWDAMCVCSVWIFLDLSLDNVPGLWSCSLQNRSILLQVKSHRVVLVAGVRPLCDNLCLQKVMSCPVPACCFGLLEIVSHEIYLLLTNYLFLVAN